ncbi:MAG: helix-turn-helix domain-containing protein [Actinomycetota bacterium]
MRYRVEQLAAACDVSVDTVRYYQSRGLLPQPEREGRVAWYGDEHEARIREIRTLQAKGLTLAAIRRVVTGELGSADADLAAAVAAARGESGDETELLDLDAFAARSGVPASLIQAVEREGIRLGRVVDGEDRYTAGDIELVRTALRLLEFGLPLPDLLGLARDADTAMRGLAERAVELFDEHVRKPIRDTAGDDDVAATQMVEAFGELLPAVTQLISYHFRRVLLETAEEHIEEATG